MATVKRERAGGPVTCSTCQTVMHARFYRYVIYTDAGMEIGERNFCSAQCRSAHSRYERAYDAWLAGGKVGARPTLSIPGVHQCSRCGAIMDPEVWATGLRMCEDCSPNGYCRMCDDPLDAIALADRSPVCSYCLEEVEDAGGDLPEDMLPPTCATCSGPLHGRRRGATFCSDTCRHRAKNLRRSQPA